MHLDEVVFERHGAVAEIVLNRPGALNAITARPGGMRDQLVHALSLAEQDPAVGCVLVRGEGRSFCAGGDLTGNPQRKRPADDFRFLEEVDGFHRRFRTSTLPVLAAVHGHCLGAGLTLAASCDLVLASASARFGFPEARLGLVGASAIVTMVGRQWAKFLMITGEVLTAEQARQIGLVLTVEPDAELLDRARDLASRIARLPREAVLLNRRCIDAVADAAGDSAARVTSIAYDAVTASMAAWVTAPDGRTFRSIIEAEGMEGLKAARDAQFREPWLRSPR
jgi:enoyl-CoA hydratase/carnithine racemase